MMMIQSTIFSPEIETFANPGWVIVIFQDFRKKMNAKAVKA